MSLTKAVIFDLDGTILDTLNDLADSMNRVLIELGCATHQIAAYRYFVGDGIEKLAFRVLPEDRRDSQTVDRCVEMMRQDYGQNWQKKTCLYDGIAEMLTSLSEKKIKLAILSNKPDNLTKTVVRHFFPQWNFEIIAGAREGIPKKPDPAGIFIIVKKFGFSRKEFLYLGDTSTDMKAARQAGIYSVGALWGFRTESELKQGGAMALLDKPMKLINYLEEQGR